MLNPAAKKCWGGRGHDALNPLCEATRPPTRDSVLHPPYQMMGHGKVGGGGGGAMQTVESYQGGQKQQTYIEVKIISFSFKSF